MADVNDLYSDYHVLLIIEWDGQKPNGTWYDFLHSKNVWTRPPKELRDEYPTAMAWRAAQLNGKTPVALAYAQGGAYLCRNEDVANMIGDVAKKQNVQSVVVGQTFIKNMNIAEADMKHFEAMRVRKSKRGRKPIGESGFYVLTCHAEGITTEVKAESMPEVCPSCGRFRIRTHMGRKPTFVVSNDDYEDILDLWWRSRFNDDGTFVVPFFTRSTKGQQLPVEPHVNPERLPAVKLPDNFPADDPDVMLRVLDAVWCLDRLLGEDYRKKERLNVYGAYLNSENADYKRWSMARPRNGYDLLDVCIVAEEYKEYL